MCARCMGQLSYSKFSKICSRMGLHVQFSGELTFENTSPIKPVCKLPGAVPKFLKISSMVNLHSKFSSELTFEN